MADAGGETNGGEPRVLELRVHGVANTSPSALVDLPADRLSRVGGDARASFWLASPRDGQHEGERGYIPPGIRREAYSWGGLVRDDPGDGGARGFRVIRDAVALWFQVLALPFSIGNAAMWTRRLTLDDDPRRVRLRGGVTAALARLFGLVLTLLFTSAAITIVVDIGALQCAAGAGCTWIWNAVWGLLTAVVPDGVLTADRVLAASALVPVLSVGLLVWFADIGRRRYDTLHTRADDVGARARQAVAQSRSSGPGSAEMAQKSLLAQPAFWSNRISGRLALVHLASATALTTTQVALHAAVGGGEDCAAGALACLGQAASEPGQRAYVIVLWIAAVTLVLSLAGAGILPTMTITPRGQGGGPLSAWIAWTLIGLSGSALVALLVLLSASTDRGAAEPAGLYAADFPPLALVTLGALLAVSGVAWRPLAGRTSTAWLGCAPAVFMVTALALGMLMGAAGTTLATMLVTGLDAPAVLAAGMQDDGGLHVPDVFLAVGGAIAVALAVCIVVLASFLLPRKLLSERATSWSAVVDTPSLEPLVDKRRRLAALVHHVEPAAGVLTVLTAAAIFAGLAWTWAAFATQRPLPVVVGAPSPALTGFLVVTTWALIVVGFGLAGLIAIGILRRDPGPVAVVWDITCFLPRTAQPFGPPCYAERAVPDVAQRLDDWLEADPAHTAVLAAHSMGALISVAALGLLAASDRTALSRVALLSFGVQLRTLFGRFLPELVGPGVLGTFPAYSARAWRRDPWARDARDGDHRAWATPADRSSLTRLRGALLPDEGVPWINLWRLTDYLGFPALAGRTSFHSGADSFSNDVDRYAEEVDHTVDPPVVMAHDEYIRAPSYRRALLDLAGMLPGGGTASVPGAESGHHRARGT